MPSVLIIGAAATPRACWGAGLLWEEAWWRDEGVGPGAVAQTHVPFVTSYVTLSRMFTFSVPEFPLL